MQATGHADGGLRVRYGRGSYPPMPRVLLPIFLIVLVDVLALTIVLPLLPFYAERFGASPQTVGLLVASFAACQLVSGPLLGQLSDRYGRKPLLALSQCGTLLGFLLIAQAHALWMVFAGRILDGLTAGNLSLAQAYIADVTAPSQRARAFGVIGVAFGLGFLFGPALSGWLAHYDYTWPMYGAAALSATSIVATLVLLPRPGAPVEAPPLEGSLRGERAVGPSVPPTAQRLGLLQWGHYAGYFRRPALGGVLGRFFLFGLSFALFTSGFALFAERRLVTAAGRAYGPREVGYVFAYAGFVGLILQGGLIGRMVKRWGESRIVTWGLGTMGVGYVVLGGVSTLPGLVVAATLASVGSAVLRPTLTALVTQRVDRSEQGMVLGLTQSLTSLASIVAPTLGGALIGRGWLGLWAVTAGVVALVGLAIADRGVSAAAASPAT
jgi:DHA1 family tetracycline resistance protein-like MFS transporter